jgi:hypothetical protein
MQIGAPLLNAESDLEALAVATLLISIAAARGDEATVERCLSRATRAKDSTIVDLRVSANFTLARAAIESGATKQALSMAKELLSEESAASETIEDVFALSIEAAIALGDETALIELEAFVAGLPPARATPLLRSGRARVRAELAHRAGDETALERSEDEALALLREVGARPTLARALIEKARRGQDAGALAEARSIYEDLGAARWLERIEQLSEVAA